jgi:hypothetical protein
LRRGAFAVPVGAGFKQAIWQALVEGSGDERARVGKLDAVRSPGRARGE